jgi:hypothetical protein
VDVLQSMCYIGRWPHRLRHGARWGSCRPSTSPLDWQPSGLALALSSRGIVNCAGQRHNAIARSFRCYRDITLYCIRLQRSRQPRRSECGGSKCYYTIFSAAMLMDTHIPTPSPASPFPTNNHSCRKLIASSPPSSSSPSRCREKLGSSATQPAL